MVWQLFETSGYKTLERGYLHRDPGQQTPSQSLLLLETVLTRQNGPLPLQNQRHRENLVPHEPRCQKGNEASPSHLETPKAIQHAQVQETPRHDPKINLRQNPKSLPEMAYTIQPDVPLLQGKDHADRVLTEAVSLTDVLIDEIHPPKREADEAEDT